MVSLHPIHNLKLIVSRMITKKKKQRKRKRYIHFYLKSF